MGATRVSGWFSVRAQDGWGKHMQTCLCLAQSIFFELPRPVTEATKPPKATTERGEEAPRLAARTVTLSDLVAKWSKALRLLSTCARSERE
ncbi:MAG: hypothetical protein COV10_01915 [Candidatus Vogelbacteria bacterium CG10_big_fil_rev_8_21_14_0_10_51_16]|uniref:Uncharacterized protein n=1 Tax=Candidatus Vogelbacteria bacterium CG10_big_fil_rev_8_21_14_0_10_51_16 TaxID=1975045 RepID=A0A2H0REG2_9BACT|nr:MAG: hypothetical protein COV10_01915 [Candidatus Vogelbacteria bacterium CG10_big_fil_rev_8_21_14_0_10_51_16]